LHTILNSVSIVVLIEVAPLKQVLFNAKKRKLAKWRLGHFDTKHEN